MSIIWLKDNDNGTKVFMGMVEIEGNLSIFSIETTGNKKLLIETLKVDQQLESILRNISLSKKWILEKLNKLSSIETLPSVLQEIIQQESSYNGHHQHLSIATSSHLGRSSTHNLTQIITYQIDEIGWNHFVSISEDFTLLKLSIEDDKSRLHSIDLTLSQDYPVSPPIVSLSAPFVVKLEWNPSLTLQYILDTIQTSLLRYSPYFDILDDIDQNTIVLEPVPPVYAIPSRRIAITRSCSVRFVINPLNPFNFCEEIVFLGPVEETSSLRQNMGQSISKWSYDRMLRQNLEEILDVQFPSPQEQVVNEMTNECGVCYSYQLTTPDGVSSFPDQVCSNPKCARIFHYDCLINWLQSVPTNKSSFGTIFGSCPYCQEPISAKAFK